MNMPAAAAAWGDPTLLCLRQGFLGHLQPPGDSPSSIESRFLSNKCLTSADQLDLKGSHLCYGQYKGPGLWGPGDSFPPHTFQNALTHTPDPTLGQVPSVQAQCSW